MKKLDHNFARLAALKPARQRTTSPEHAVGCFPARGSAGDGDELAELLGAELARNQYGTHLHLRRWFPAPEIPVPEEAVSRLLAPEAPAAAASVDEWLFLDIETTGLAGGTGTYAFLVGVAWWDGAGLAVEQFLMRDFGEEHSLLAALAERLRERRVLVTFNGKSFDWPLLETRFRLTRVLALPSPRAHLDLLHPARHLWLHQAGGLASVRLTELERHVLGFPALGYDRRGDFPSALIPQAYFDYLRGGPAAPLAAIARHNQMDLRGLAALAARIVSLASAPERNFTEPLELLGLSRLHRRRGEFRRARELYELALAAGLPGALKPAAQRELALLAKRDRDYARAAALWQQLAARHNQIASVEINAGPNKMLPASSANERKAGPAAGTGIVLELEACEQLAIYYEHRARQPEHAAALARAALDALDRALRAGAIDSSRHRKLRARLDHRLARVERKCRRLLASPLNILPDSPLV